MISYDIDGIYLQDLEDDFLMNEDKNLYQFIGKDCTRAFHLGRKIDDWFENLDAKKKYLYSKSLRHVVPDIMHYKAQLSYWNKSYLDREKSDNIDLKDFSEYVINNVICNPETEEEDLIKISLYLGLQYGEAERKFTKSE